MLNYYDNSRKSESALRYVDWTTVVIYLLLVFFGAVSIYAASYDFDHASIFSMAEFSGKQIMWIGISMVVAFVILMIDARMFEAYAYPVYLAVMLLLFITIFIAPNINGSRSWIQLGSMSLQPAEFAKFATALALARLFGTYGFHLDSRDSYLKVFGIILAPMLLIVLQHETGSALVFTSLLFVVYREGMSGLILSAVGFAIVFFVVAIKFSTTLFLGIPTGHAIVFIMIMIMIVCMDAFYCKNFEMAKNTTLIFVGSGLIVWILHLCGVGINGYLYFITALLAAMGYCVFELLQGRSKGIFMTIGAALASVIFLFSVNFAFNNVLHDYQQKRVRVALGIEDDARGAGYNVNQSMIAIGSGGFTGKGFLNGTQTKLKYVPEQHTDFIYCTIGEEEGFLGASAVLLLFLFMILRVIAIAERQPTTFSRVYAYCVASYFIFHLSINIGMVLGLCPVIGIPLPFFSYGGSSLVGFTILLFILLRLDSSRREYVR